MDEEETLPTELLEQLAALEHARWAGWMTYLFSKCYTERGLAGHLMGGLVIPGDSVKHWQRQVDTPYEDLTEREKESDRAKVRKYAHLVRPR